MNKALVTVSTMLGYHTGLPAVTIRIGEFETSLTVDSARRMAEALLRCAEAAVSDAYLFHFATEQVGVDVETAAKMIANFRQFRLTTHVDEEEES